jgi:hypothetical protein
VVGLALVYQMYNPATNHFPKCPFLQLTGYQCPGCGSQRAIHHLLNFEVKEAFALNPLLLVSIPYLLVGFLFETVVLNERMLTIRKFLFGSKAIQVILVAVLSFWIGRNLI